MKHINQIEPWIGEEEKNALLAYIESGGWLTEFKMTQQFEHMIAQYVDCENCIATPSGTIALLLGMLALDLDAGDEVLVPDYTMIASANAIILAGGSPILVDIDPFTLSIDLKAAENAITAKTRAMILVSINGRSPDMGAALDLCHKYNIHLIEDAAQSLGSRYQGKHLGTFGTLGCFSFSVPKVITTGQGGAIVTNNPAISEKLRLIKDFGRYKPGIDRHEVIGYNFKYTDLQAVIGIEQMKKLPQRVQRKKEMYTLYHRLLSPLPAVRFISTNLQDVSPWFIDILVDANVRDALVDFLKENGIGSRPFYPSIHTQPPYALSKGDFPWSQKMSAEGLWLPSSSFLTDEDIKQVCKSITEFFQK